MAVSTFEKSKASNRKLARIEHILYRIFARLHATLISKKPLRRGYNHATVLLEPEKNAIMSTGTPKRVTVCTQANPQYHLRRDYAKGLAHMHVHVHADHPSRHVNGRRRRRPNWQHHPWKVEVREGR